MRMRKKKRAGARILACSDDGYMNWRDFFAGGNNPVKLEIGCGKGEFICAKALQSPSINYIAVERIQNVIVAAMEKARSLNLPNLKFIIADAKRLAEFFNPDTISAIYLNFSDPWHKRYQQDKRLTSPPFLETYKKFLKPGAKIILKTDDKDFFEYSLRSLPPRGFLISHKTHDLYDSEFLDGNIQTEYEKKFTAQDIKICYLSAVYNHHHQT